MTIVSHAATPAGFTLVLGLWAVVAAATVAVTWVRQSRARIATHKPSLSGNGAASRDPDCRRSSPWMPAVQLTNNEQRQEAEES
jgi:hypothetical protein